MSFEQEIKLIFSNYGFNLTQNQIEKFKKYYNFLIIYNKKVNLTTITSQTDVIVKHFLDSVLSINQIKPNLKIIDIGTGAGFPGIPIKIMRDDIKLTLVDSLNKRIIFLNQLVEILELKNVEIIHSRSEELAHNLNYREKFDICVNRAVAKLSTLIEYSVPFLKINGLLVSYKAKNCKDEINESVNAVKLLHLKLQDIINFNILESNSERNLIIFKKLQKTGSGYPRLNNKPKTQPLN